jgi:hypothetical protein
LTLQGRKETSDVNPMKFVGFLPDLTQRIVVCPSLPKRRNRK